MYLITLWSSLLYLEKILQLSLFLKAIELSLLNDQSSFFPDQTYTPASIALDGSWLDNHQYLSDPLKILVMILQLFSLERKK